MIVVYIYIYIMEGREEQNNNKAQKTAQKVGEVH
jgi:hypothetical protein